MKNLWDHSLIYSILHKHIMMMMLSCSQSNCLIQDVQLFQISSQALILKLVFSSSLLRAKRFITAECIKIEVFFQFTAWSKL